MAYKRSGVRVSLAPPLLPEMNTQKIIFIILGLFFFLHIARDYLQIKYGYSKDWFVSFGHVWHAPQYEKQGMVVCLVLGCFFIFLAFRHAA